MTGKHEVTIDRLRRERARGSPAMKGTMMDSKAVCSAAPVCAEVPVTCIPVNYRRKHLPRYAQMCYVEGPEWDEVDRCYIRLGGTKAHVAACRKLFLTEEEAVIIFRAIFQEAEPAPTPPQPIVAVSSSLLPNALANLDTSHSLDLDGEVRQAMLAHALTSAPQCIDGLCADGVDMQEEVSSLDQRLRLPEVWYVANTSVTDDEGRRMVRASRLAHRFSGRSSGPVYIVWMDEATLAQAMPLDQASEIVDAPFEALDSHTQRVEALAYALSQGAELPVLEVERACEVAVTTDRLADYELLATKDPISVRQEDVLSAASPEMLLSTAIAAIEREQALLRTLIAQQREDAQHPRSKQQVAIQAQVRAAMEQDERLTCLRDSLRETLNWYRRRKRHLRGERILCLCRLEPRETSRWRTMPDAAYWLIVGVPIEATSVRQEQAARNRPITLGEPSVRLAA